MAHFTNSNCSYSDFSSSCCHKRPVQPWTFSTTFMFLCTCVCTVYTVCVVSVMKYLPSTVNVTAALHTPRPNCKNSCKKFPAAALKKNEACEVLKVWSKQILRWRSEGKWSVFTLTTVTAQEVRAFHHLLHWFWLFSFIYCVWNLAWNDLMWLSSSTCTSKSPSLTFHTPGLRPRGADRGTDLDV